ncbi:TonB-dependent receptor [Arenimonas sp. MALMAid1274]|uniref:TonB-dependent receptor n=1 Tax=Arenimonas sp. MALMAid1274 TaxID=3411630 RepID=UPI003BA233DB
MTNRNRVRLSQLSLGLAIALAAAPAFAQNTTAAVGGRIVSGDSQPVAGAQVTIVHAPSGTVSNATTGADGRYSARGLRVGGPYTITIVKDGVTETREGVYLQLAETTAVDATLGQGDTTTLDVVEVTGTAIQSEVFSASNMGATTAVNREQLDAFASIQRNLQDYARLDPRLSQTDKERGEISLGGQNSRFNSITIDGVNTSDTFGLEANNLPTAKQPISIDTIESVQINVSNYDVTQTGYTGANINAVTKSGTNEFSGTLTYVYRDDRLAGDRLNTTSGEYFDSPEFEEETKGITFGGPLIKDRLFFFAAYEEFTSSRLAPEFGPIGSEFTNVGITQAQIDQTIAIANGYGMDVGTQEFPTDAELSVEDSLLKLDWNITDAHRMSLRYNKTEQSEPIYYGFGIRSLSLSSHWTTQEKVFESLVGQLFSDWSENFSTELKIARRTYDSVFNNNSDLPTVSVQFTDPTPPGVPSGTRTLLMGTENSRHFNQLNTETTSAYFAGNLFIGDHELKFGMDYDDNEIFNAFLQNTKGNYVFSCLLASQCANSFQAGRPFTYTSQQPRAGLTLQDGAAQWSNQNIGLFIQDTWSVNYNLTLMAGIRLDTPNIDEEPLFNAAANAATIARTSTFGRQTGGFGYDNSVTIDGKELIQPRFGFNYTFDSERPTQLRGGFGLFQGAAANVWLSNPYSNTGLATQVFSCGGSSPACPLGSIFSGDPDNQPRPVGSQPAANVDIIDPDLEQPAIWKANLAFEHELPFWGLVASAELLLTKTETGIFYEHLNLGQATRIGPDGRELYWNANGYNPANWNAAGQGTGTTSRASSNSSFGNVILARPSDKGHGEMLTVSLSKPMSNDWAWSLAYTYADATDVSPLTSSTSNSNWNGRMIFNPNEEVEATSNYLVKDRFSGALQWRRNFFGDYKTEFAVFYEGRRGKPYSWTYINDFNGDGIAGNDLMYIPNPGEVSFRDRNGNGTGDEEAAFWAIINANPELRGNVGQVVDRNNSYNPWINSFDVRISQELPGFFKGNKTVIALDILNVGNLLNKDWGQINEIGFPSNRSFVWYNGLDAQGRYVYNVGGVEDPVNRQARGESSWAAQLTLRYEF